MALNAVDASLFTIPSSTLVKLYPINQPLSSLGFDCSSSFSAASLKKLNLRKQLQLPVLSSPQPTSFRLYSTAENVTVAEEEEEEEQQQQQQQKQEDDNGEKPESRRKLFVLNLPWSFSVADIKNLFGECGTVSDVEIIKQKDGKNRGFAFVTMGSGEEAQAAIQKFDSYEVVGRIIRVQFAKRFKKPPRPTPAAASSSNSETRHMLYVSNLAWKVRSNNLREFFSSSEFNPVSAKVVFDNPSGKSAGYGFVSFATREEAESAISGLDGKELLGRPIRLKFSERNTDSASDQGKEDQEALVEM